MGCTATTLLLSFCATTCFCVLTSSDGISVLPSRSDSTTNGKDWTFCYLNICMCSGPLANCRFGHLTYIPTLWDNITQLNFTDNNLHWISNDTFANITHLNLHFLSLAWNKIQNISDDALAELRELKHLDLTGNDLLTPIDLATAFQGLDNIPLESLTLSGMKLKHVPLNMFHGMKNNVLKYLVLEKNHLEEYNQDAFSILGNIRVIELGGNKISSLKWGHAPYLSRLALDGNVITEVPSFCGVNSSFYPKLKMLYLEHNLLTETRPHMFKCLPHINILGLNANPIEGVETNTFSELPRLKTIFLKNLKGSKMYIKNHAFNNSNIKRITMEGSHFTYSDNNVDADSFSGSTGLKSLDLSFSDMYGVNESFFMRLFKDLRGLGGLALGDCKLVSVPDAIPLMLHNLVYLKLFNNRLTFLPKDLFRNLTKLTHLSVDGNKIPEFDEDTFPEKLRKRLRKVNLANNPFSCTCSIRWFLSWVHQDKKKFLQFPYFYKCSSPAYYLHKSLSEISFSEQSCLFERTVYVAVLGGTVPLIIVFVVCALLYRWRWQIRYYMYLLRRHDDRIVDEQHLTYDGYVVYSTDDTPWIIKEVLPNLEDKHGLALCVHERDFDVGGAIVDNIVESVEDSRKVLIVLSQNSIQSEWCQFSINYAHRKSLVNGPESLIVILKEEISSRFVSSSIRLLLDPQTYILWPADDEDVEARVLFWERVAARMKGVTGRE